MVNASALSITNAVERWNSGCAVRLERGPNIKVLQQTGGEGKITNGRLL